MEKTIKVSDVDGVWHQWTAHGIEISFGFAFPDVCPSSLMQLPAGVLRDGMFYPYGTVSTHFFKLQQTKNISIKQPPHLYFIQSEKGGPIKIGVSNDPMKRLNTLQTAHPYKLKIIGMISHGGHKSEKEMHERFADIRLNGEWFEPSNELMEVIYVC